jgi:ribosomal protein S18 acetylase RimI-like enzyme
MFEIRGAHPEQIDEIAAFIAGLQVDPRHHIAYLDVRAEGISAWMLESPGEAWDRKTALAYDERGKLIGCVMYDYTPETHHRVWMNGPFCTEADPEIWQAVADALYARAPQPTPGQLMEHEVFIDTANENIARFAERHHFLKLSPAAALVMTRDVWARGKDYLPAAEGIRALDPSSHDALRALHPALFPNTYASADELIADQEDGEHILLSEVAEGRLRGYLAAQIDEAGELYIDFLGVAPDFRRMGVGRRLITRALGWGFDQPSVPKAHLTVSADNDGAIALYVALGFTHERTMVAYRKRFDAATPPTG